MSTSDTFNQSLLDFRQGLARKLMAGFVVFCTIALPLSLSRWPELGFQYIFVHHILLTVISYITFLRPNKSNYKVDIIVIVLLLSSMIVSGTLSFGLQAGGVTFVVFCSFLLVIAFGFIAALSYSILWCIYILTLGYLFSHSYIEYAVSPNEYGATVGSWAIVAVGSSLTIILMLITAKQGFYYFKSLVEEIEQQKEEIQHLANTDALTGFATGRLAAPLLNQTVNLAERENSHFAVVFMDLNNFKKINDTYGHDAGDYVLQETAARIRSVLRDMDITLRIGGDEFLFIFPKVKKDSEEINGILYRITQTWLSPICFENAKIMVSGSMGVAVYPIDGNNAHDLRQKADAAMYYAKNNNIPIKFV